MNPDPYDFIPDHMVYSTQAHTEKKTDSTYYTEPYADVPSPQTGAAKYYNIPEKPKARNPDYENSPAQPDPTPNVIYDVGYEPSGNAPDPTNGDYEGLQRVEHEKIKKGKKNKVYAGLKKKWIEVGSIPCQS